MYKKLFISFFVLIVLLTLVVISGIYPVKSHPSSDKRSETIISKLGQKITYTTEPVDGLWVHSMSWNSENVWATTSSSQNPFSSCRDEFISTKQESKDNRAATNDWIDFYDNGYTFSLKYPSMWIIQKHLVNGKPTLDLTRNGHLLQILEDGGSLETSVCNQGDYYSITMGKVGISRPKKSSIFEEGQAKYFSLCNIFDINNGGTCDGKIEISPGNSLSIMYVLQKGGSFDPELVDEMDSIVGTIKPKNN